MYGTHFSLVLRFRPVMFVEADTRGRQKFAAENATTDIRDVQCLRVTARWKPRSPKNQRNVRQFHFIVSFAPNLV